MAIIRTTSYHKNETDHAINSVRSHSQKVKYSKKISLPIFQTLCKGFQIFHLFIEKSKKRRQSKTEVKYLLRAFRGYKDKSEFDSLPHPP